MVKKNHDQKMGEFLYFGSITVWDSGHNQYYPGTATVKKNQESVCSYRRKQHGAGINTKVL